MQVAGIQTTAKRKRNPRAEADVTHGSCASPFYSINQFSRRNPVFTPASLRWMIFQSAENGLDQSGALIRNGRSIVIDEPVFFAWFRSRRSPA